MEAEGTPDQARGVGEGGGDEFQIPDEEINQHYVASLLDWGQRPSGEYGFAVGGNGGFRALQGEVRALGGSASQARRDHDSFTRRAP